MGSKSKGKRQNHPTMSYETQVAVAVQRALKGDIQRMKGEALQELRMDIEYTFQHFERYMRALTDIALERFGLTNDDLENRVLDIEDKAEGTMTTVEGIKKGDTVRFKVKDLNSKEPERALKVNNIASDKAQLAGDLEQQMLGMRAGESKDIKVLLGETEKKEFTFRVEIKRVSARILDEAVQSETTGDATPGDSTPA